MNAGPVPGSIQKQRLRLRAVAIAVALLLAASSQATAERRKNGFALEPGSIPAADILGGGPGRDGIPALSRPKTLSASEASWPDGELVVGVVRGGEARAYPLSILVWHELVNDVLGGEPTLVSYCPLCGTSMVFDRRIGQETLTFGVSGLLYQSDLLMYDRQSDSLWSQISAEAVTGKRLRQRLRMLRSQTQRWGDWKREHPTTDVLDPDTGYRRGYGRSPYGDYERSRRLLFPVDTDDRYHPKAWTLGLRIPGGAARAYPSPELERAGDCVRDDFEGHPVEVQWDRRSRTFLVSAPPELEVVQSFWFAWAAFHPQTTVFRSPRSPVVKALESHRCSAAPGSAESIGAPG